MKRKAKKKKASPTRGRQAARRAPLMKWNAHLSFDGRCAEAFALYERALGGRTTFVLKYGDSPLAERTPADFRDKVLHGTFARGDLVLTGADVLPDQYRKPEGTWLLLHVDEPAEADRVFAALADGGSVHLPIAETFWARRFGMVVDPFGTPWIVQCSS
jgi:PhnB protein